MDDALTAGANTGRPARHWRQRITIAFLAGLILGPLMDQMHVLTGTLSYDTPWLLGQAWWVGPQFGVAFVIVGELAIRIEDWRASRGLGPLAPARSLPALLLMGWAAYLLTGLLHERIWLVTIVLAAAFAARIVYEPLDRATVFVSVLFAIGGTTWESLLTHVPGAFGYADGIDGVGSPPWLPLIYLHGGPLTLRAMQHLRGPR